MKRFVAIGEAMIELSGAGPVPEVNLWRVGVAGDTLNTAWYARELLPPDWDVDYVSRVGGDPFSDQILAFLQDAGIGTAHVGRDISRNPGLYAIRLDGGERSFTYWRENSAARTLADNADLLANALSGADMIYFSGITLAILKPDRRAVLLDSVAEAGAQVAFDPNFRPQLWESGSSAREWITRAASIACCVLPSADDDCACFGDDDPQATRDRYAALGVAEVVVKNAGGPIHLWDGAARVVTDLEKVAPVDTTGAGDSFNAGYLAARIAGSSVTDAAVAGHRLAMRVVAGRGALVPPEEPAPKEEQVPTEEP